ncbi:hypothetical protein CENSYa_1532 [Cenarchaeum symbiosum A]|uniref:Uncharacterized protein n=1 Tax=Cenarchaeum symbiosum (strain A) TaxID=414004 RepID=A0RXT7_CENSY|nr:hypothetical protein CENSYa_1532 [Cenarchaeum symbiosum A]
MQYFQAVQTGKQRAGKSQKRLFDIAGFAMLILTNKKTNGVFSPVGEEDYGAVIAVPEGFAAILVDGDGYTKAQTKALPKEEAVKIYRKALETGVEKFSGKEVMIWSEYYPVIEDV